ncbi:MAG: iron-containing alcohol dehydrogenase [Bacteroidales bacterium]|nr:iron-containing alcohol dehydrogenase [Bacteroidales bacterium]
MNNFTFYSPTEFVFGRETETQVGLLCKKYGASRVMLVYGGGSVVRSGLLDKVKQSLTEQDIAFCELGGVQPNPIDTKVYEGLELAKSFAPDFLLPVGGGSTIDTAKAIAAGYYYEGDFWDFYVTPARPTKALPLGVVLTIPAAGSEGSGNTVITNTKTHVKNGLRMPMLLRPKFAIMNPELTMTLPEWQTASGISDMIAHILERYLSNTPDVQIGDRLAEGMILAIMEEAEKVIANPKDYEARANIMWSGTIAHNDTCSLGRQEDWNSHAMEHEISAEYDVTHGAGLAVVFPAFLKYAANHNPHKVAQLAHRVFGVADSGDASADAHEGAKRFKTWLHDKLHLPVNFAQLGVPEPNIELMNTRLHKLKGEVLQGYMQLDADATKVIYEYCKE